MAFKPNSIQWPLAPAALCLLSIIFAACSTQRNAGTEETQIAQEYYRSSYPSQPVSPLLNEVMESVKRIISTSYYTHYLFEEGSQITKLDIQNGNFKSHVADTSHTNQSTSGTATIIDKQPGKIALISCAHIIESPDTVYHHHYTEDQQRTPYLRSVSIRSRKQDMLLSGTSIDQFELVARNSDKDLIVMTVNNSGATEEEPDYSNAPELDIQLGRVDRLNMGVMSYILGYPSGRAMVTRALISTPSDKISPDKLWLDALFNPGLSGGLMLAFRDGGSRVHWIGLASGTQAVQEVYLAPSKRISREAKYDPNLPYNDNLYIEQARRINYGLANGISAHAIRTFLQANQTKLSRHGININSMLLKPADNDSEDSAQ